MEQVGRITQVTTDVSSPIIKLGRLVKDAITYTTSMRSEKKDWPPGSWVCECGKLLVKPNGEGKVAGQVKCKTCGTINER